MEQVVPWKARLKAIEPFYPVAGQGRRPYPLESMSRQFGLMEVRFRGLRDASQAVETAIESG